MNMLEASRSLYDVGSRFWIHVKKTRYLITTSNVHSAENGISRKCPESGLNIDYVHLQAHLKSKNLGHAKESFVIMLNMICIWEHNFFVSEAVF